MKRTNGFSLTSVRFRGYNVLLARGLRAWGVALLLCYLFLLEGGWTPSVAAQTAGLVFEPSPVQVDEGDSTPYTVKLVTRPSGSSTVWVSIAVSSVSGRTGNIYRDPPHFNLDKNRLIFTQENWNSPQTVTVSIGEDDNWSTNWTAFLMHTALGGDYSGVTAKQDVWIRDNDAAGQGTVTVTSVSQEVYEGESAQFLMRFSPAVKQDILNPQLVLTWDGNFGNTGGHSAPNSAGCHTVYAGHSSSYLCGVQTYDDATEEMDGSVTATVIHRRLPGYRVGSPGSATVIIKDDDAPGEMRPLVSVTGKFASITEGGEAAFNVGVWPVPTSPITVNMFIEDHGNFVSAADLGAKNIQVGGASQNATYAVKTIDDSIDEPDANLIVNLSSGQGYKIDPSLPRSFILVKDNDELSVEITGVPEKISSTANLTATFTFTKEVTGFGANAVTVTGGMEGSFSGSGDTYQVAVTPTQGMDLTVEVAANSATAANDATIVGPDIPVSATAVWDASTPTLSISGPTTFNSSTSGITAMFTFSEAVTGFETPDVRVTGGTKGELTGSGDTYSLVITPHGGSDVTITVGADVATDGTNTAPERAVTHTVTYLEILVLPSNIDIWEGQFNSNRWAEVWLNHAPSSDVTVTVSGYQGASLRVPPDPLMLIFGKTDYNRPKRITLSAGESDNFVDENFTLKLTASGAAEYVDAETSFAVTIHKELSWLIFNPMNSSMDEDTSTDIGIKLKLKPSSDVTVTVDRINSSGYLRVTDPSELPLTFTPTNWNTFRSINFTADIDGDMKDEVASVNFTASGAEYDGFYWYNYTIWIRDKDKAKFKWDPPLPGNVVEGEVVTLTATLDRPLSNAWVIPIRARSNRGNDLSSDLEWLFRNLTIKKGEKTATTTLKVLADSENPESDEHFWLGFNVNTDRPQDVYVDGQAQTLIRISNRFPEIKVAPSEVDVNEGATVSNAFGVSLNNPPSADVAVTITGHDGTVLEGSSPVSPDPETLMFTPTNYGTAQPVKLVAKEDDDDDVDDEITLTFTGSGAAEYNVSTDLVVTVIDNDEIPTLQITGLPSHINNTTPPLMATFTFSEDVTEFDASKVTVTNGTKGTFSGSGTTYTLVLTPGSGKDLTVSVAARVVAGGVSRGPVNMVSVTSVWDAMPTLAISGVPVKINDRTAFTAAFTFSEAVTGFLLADDITVTGGTAGALTGIGASYSLPITPAGNADVVVTVSANSVTDGVNAGPASEVTATAVWDAAVPTLTISGVPAKINDRTAFTAAFTFSEAVTGFLAAEVSVTGGAASGFTGSGASYSATITPDGGENVVVSVAAEVATDGVNLAPGSPVTVTAVWDAAVPTLAISGVPAKINDRTAFTAAFTFSEAVTGFLLADDITVTGGTAGALTGIGASYSLPITPAGNADVVVTVSANSVTDGVNAGPASEVTATAVWDAAVPTLTISGVPAKINDRTAFTAAFTFSEAVTGFLAAEVSVTGGAASGFTGSGASYSATITPDGGENVVVSVAAEVATDGVNLAPGSPVTVTAVWDAAVPTLAISGVPAKINDRTAFTAAFTFSEAVTGFLLADDITVTGGTAGALTGIGASYSLPITPAGNADVVVTVSANSVTDGVNAGPASEVTATAVWDAAVPTLTISGVPAKINDRTAFTAAFTFSEAVTGFLAAEVSVTGGAASGFTGSGASYSATITPDGGENVVVSVAAEVATDGVNLAPGSPVTATAVWDAAVPTLAISGVPAKINDRTAFTAAFTFSEAVTGFLLADDITVTGGTAGALTGIGASYSLPITPAGNADVVVTVSANSVTDGVNAGPASEVTATAVWDAAVPTLTISGVPAKINDRTAFTAAFTFSEAVTGFLAAEVSVTGGAASGSTGSGASYSATITPDGGENVVVSVAAEVATDGVNLAPGSPVTVTAVWDAAVPTLAISGVPAKINDRTAFTAAFTFSEAVTGFLLADDITVTGGTAGALTGIGASYSLPITPAGNADVVVTVSANSVTDGVNAGPASEVTATAVWDAAVPTLTISGVPAKINDRTAFTAAFTFSEAVTGFLAAEVSVTGGAASGFTGSGASYSATITPDGGENVVVSVAAEVATDGVNLAPGSPVTVTAVWDAAVPTLAISGVPAKINDRTAFTAAFTFSEAVTGFLLADDITVTGGTAGALTGIGASYSLPITPAGNADVVVTVSANSVTDGVNAGPASEVTATAVWDAAVPTLTISGVPAKINDRTAFTAAFTFSEAVTGFLAAEVSVTGGAASGFTGSGASYSATITPDGGENVVVSVAAEVATDGVNLAPGSPVTVTAVWDAAVPTLAISGVPAKINDRTAFTAAFTFSEAVTGFLLADDITVTGGTAGALTGIGASYSLPITPAGNADVVVTVSANSVTDGVNAGPASEVTATAVWDAAVPTLTISGVPAKINDRTAFTAAFTFSEAVTGFLAAEVSVTGGAASGFTGSGASYSATITPDGGENVVVSVAAEVATDGVNLAPGSPVTATAVWDAAVPTLAISGVPAKINDRTAFTAAFTFSEAVTGFLLADDITVTGGTAGALTGIGASYSLPITPAGNADVVVTVSANSVTDGVNAGPASEVTATAVWDAAVPTLTISGVPAKINDRTAFTAAFTFSEAVTGFLAAEVSVTGGAASGSTGSGASYSATITPDGGGECGGECGGGGGDRWRESGPRVPGDGDGGLGCGGADAGDQRGSRENQ